MIRKTYPLSHAQQRIWVLKQLTPCDYLYHIPVILPLASEVDLNALQKAFKELVSAEEVLSARLFREQEELFWTVEQNLPFTFDKFSIDYELPFIVDISTDSNLEQFFLKPISLNNYPLFRCGILSTPSKNYLLLVIDHILVDGWSIHLLIERINHYYQSRVMPDAQINSYAEYVKYEKEANSLYVKELTYWETRLKHKTIPIDLITDKPRHMPLSGKGDTLHFSLNYENLMNLQQLASAAQCTLMQLVLFGFAVMLSRYSGQDEVVVGIPVMGRPNQRWYKTIGLFVNTCLHAVSLSQDLNVLEHLQQIKENLFTDMAHAMPFDEMVKALYASRQMDPKAQFNVLYNFIQMEEGVSPIGYGMPKYCTLPISKFDISLHIYAYKSKLDIFFEYSKDLYQADTIQSMAEYFLMLLNTMSSSKQNSLSDWICQLSAVELGALEFRVC